MIFTEERKRRLKEAYPMVEACLDIYDAPVQVAILFIDRRAYWLLTDSDMAGYASGIAKIQYEEFGEVSMEELESIYLSYPGQIEVYDCDGTVKEMKERFHL